jgi:hypothetical protein
MSRSSAFAARCLAIIAAIALIQTMSAPSTTTRSPYLSALSNLSVGPVFAFPIDCPNKSCGGKKGCRSDHGFYCDTSSGSCQTSKCL